MEGSGAGEGLKSTELESRFIEFAIYSAADRPYFVRFSVTPKDFYRRRSRKKFRAPLANLLRLLRLTSR
jgi:hypothetical protein